MRCSSGSSARRRVERRSRSPRRRAAGRGSARARGEAGCAKRAQDAQGVTDQRIRARRSANLESDETLRILVRHLDRGDLGTARAATGELDELLDGAGLALEDRLDLALDGVANPARDAGRLGAATRGIAEEDPLDPTPDDDPLAGQGLVLVVLGGDADAGAAEDLGGGHRRRLNGGAAEAGGVPVRNRGVRGRGAEDEIALGDLLPVTGDGHRPAAADDDVDLLGLFVRVELLIYPRRDLEPCHGKIPRAQFSRVHEDVITDPVPLLGGSLREPPDQHALFLADQGTDGATGPVNWALTTRPLSARPGSPGDRGPRSPGRSPCRRGGAARSRSPSRARRAPPRACPPRPR